MGAEIGHYIQLTVRNWPPERIFVIDLEIDGFSATQRTFIGSGMQALEVSTSNNGGRGTEPQAMLIPSTLRHDTFNSSQRSKLCASAQSE